MKRLVGALGFGFCGAGALMLSAVNAGPAATQETTKDAGQLAVEANIPPVTVVVEEPAPATEIIREKKEIGVELRPVSEELASHLGLASGMGVLVVDVEEGSIPQQAGLRRHDVVLSINGEDALASELRESMESGEGLALRVARAGVERMIALPAEGEEVSGFLSTASLGPDHPFRRVGQIETMLAGYSEQSERYSEMMRELQQESRGAREAAKAEAKNLRAACDEHVAQYLAAREKELLALLDERLPMTLVEPITALRVDLEKVLPAAELQALDRELEAIAETVKTRGAAVEITGDENQARERASYFKQLGRSAADRVHQRVGRPLREAREERKRHVQRLGPDHDKRAAWVTKTLTAIRKNLGDRIECATDRAGEDFSKKLERRLREMNVPQPGEIEASLADLNQQLDTMTKRFLRRAETALRIYLDEMSVRGGTMVPALGEGLGETKASVTKLTQALSAELDQHLSAPIELDGTWRGEEEARLVHDQLEAGLLERTNDGRDGMRDGSTRIERTLHEENVVSEDAWNDLRRELETLQQQSQNNCWKLDGPHLDGRFPKQKAKKKDEIAVAR